MVDGYSAEQIRAAEAPHLAAGEPLMRRAAAGLAEEIRAALHERGPEATPALAPAGLWSTDSADRGRVLLLVGSGNNGGDALFAGAELAAEGVDVAIVLTGSRTHEGGLSAALNAGAHVEPTDPVDADRLARLAGESDVIVDGILGIGTSASPALRGTAREIVAAIVPVTRAPARPIVVAVDIPSGISPDDGGVPDPLVLPADVTVTFGGLKAGLLLPPASALAGRARLIDIGLGSELAEMEPLVRLPG